MRGVAAFNGERLREAREARALTITALADLVGISKQAVSQFEKGTVAPQLSVVERLAAQLNVHPTYFLRQARSELKGVVYYRSISTARKRERVRAERRHEWLRDTVALLRRYCDLPTVNLPPALAREHALALTLEEVESIATDARRFWSLGDGPISDIVLLMENNGIITARGSLETGTLDAYSHWSPDDDTPYVYLNSDKGSAVRSRFDAAHELAHLVLHRELTSVDFRAEHKKLERQADRFASSFLLPARTFAADVRYPSLDLFRILKEKWRTSIQSMLMRSRQLNLIDEDRAGLMWRELSRRGWRKREPLDDVLAVERPRVLPRAMSLVIDSGMATASEFEHEVGILRKDLEDLTCLPAGKLLSRSVSVDVRPRGEDVRGAQYSRRTAEIFQLRDSNKRSEDL